MKTMTRLLLLAAFWVTCASGQNTSPISVLNIYPHYLPNTGPLFTPKGAPDKGAPDFGDAQHKGPNVAQWPHPLVNNILRMRAKIVKVIFKDGSTWELRN